MSIKHILLDVDGVLVDWCGEVCSLFGKPDTVVSAWDTQNFLGITEEEMWAKIDEKGADFWRYLPRYDWYPQLLSLVLGYPFTLATTPSKHPSSACGKRLWIIDNFGASFTNYQLGKEKWLMAGPGKVLIDDSDKNVKTFREHGGDAILFPQPWNSNREICGDRIDYVRSELNRFRDRESQHS